jgi:hypothetical protein
VRPLPAWSSLTVKAAATLSYCAGHVVPALHRAIEELRDLDDRSVRGIGIYRRDVEHIVRHGVPRE